MTATEREALVMITDPAFSEKEWAQVYADQRLNPFEDVEGDSFITVMYSCWVYARLAHLILAGDEAALREFMERADPKRLIRGPLESAAK